VHQILLLSREIVMPMPSLFKYFLTVGAALLGVLFLLNYLFEQPAPAVAHNAAPPKSVVVKTDPQASRVERWRAEQAAAEAARKEDAARLAAQPAEPETVASPVKAAATTASVSRGADAALTVTDASATEQPKAKSRKARTAEKARTKRLARDDVRPGTGRERTASNQQDDYYYGQRQGNAQQGYAQQGFGQRQGYAQQGFGQRPAASAYAYAPQQSFGPFGGGGWGGRGW
jgi:hypothetical protein